MKIQTNYHTHTYLCKHATGTIDDYINRAIELGYTDIGISDHCPFTKELEKLIYSKRMDMDEFINIYLPELEKAKQKYKDVINVYSAVEIEYFDEFKEFYPQLIEKLDYLILGQHYFKYEGKYVSIYSQLSSEMLEIYCNTVVEALNTGYFKIFAHPDIFNWSYPFWDDECVNVTKRIIEAAIKNNVILEINANGIRNCEKFHRYITIPSNDRKKKDVHNSAYPNVEFFKLCAETNVLIMVNDDAHDPMHIHDEETLKSYELAEKLGLNLVNKL